MRVSVVSLSGRELVSLDAGPSWHLSEVRALVPEQAAQAGCRMRVFFGEVELCGSATLAELGVGHGSELTLLFTPPRVVTGGPGSSAKLWSAASGDCLVRLQGHQGRVGSAAFSPDGRHVLTASLDGTAKIWSAASGACLHTLRGTGGASASFAPS